MTDPLAPFRAEQDRWLTALERLPDWGNEDEYMRLIDLVLQASDLLDIAESHADPVEGAAQALLWKLAN